MCVADENHNKANCLASPGPGRDGSETGILPGRRRVHRARKDSSGNQRSIVKIRIATDTISLVYVERLLNSGVAESGYVVSYPLP
jgi:hypothetical protein